MKTSRACFKSQCQESLAFTFYMRLLRGSAMPVRVSLQDFASGIACVCVCWCLSWLGMGMLTKCDKVNEAMILNACLNLRYLSETWTVQSSERSVHQVFKSSIFAGKFAISRSSWAGLGNRPCVANVFTTGHQLLCKDVRDNAM